MKAIILKPVMWSTNDYTSPSGYRSTGGFAKKNGYGHEEWNNAQDREWRGFKLFHTEYTERLLKYSENGELGILLTASHEKAQYVVAAATSVYHNDEDERKLIAKKLCIYDSWKQAWALDNVKRQFSNNKKKFIRHWKQNYEWIRWRCLKGQYYPFHKPILIDANKLTGKNRIIAMHGRFQALLPDQAIYLLERHLESSHPILEWLSTNDFDESIVNRSLREFWGKNKPPKRNKRKTKSSAPANRKFQYWVEGNRSVEPHHAKLQALFIEFLKSCNCKYQENIENVDVRYKLDRREIFSEIKPTINVETKYAIRAAIGQLFEYQYYAKDKPRLEIVIGSIPKLNEIKFVKSLGLYLSYYDSKKKTFVRVKP